MKGVLIGSDLMYRKDGKLVPIEINTNVGWDAKNRVESIEDFFNFEDLNNYVKEHNITDVYTEGTVGAIHRYWDCKAVGVTLHTLKPREIPEEVILESSSSLFIRSMYSDEAYVDSFCRDKVNFLEAIKDLDFGCEYILKTEEGLQGSITKVEDNGTLPNFIVKYRYPYYDRETYPKLLRFTTVKQLNNWVSKNLEKDYFIMPYYFNSEKGLYEGNRIRLIRNWSVWVPNSEGGLDAINIGQYTKVSAKFEKDLKWDKSGSSEDDSKVRKILSFGWATGPYYGLLAEDSDLVLMSDGTWKKASELKAGDKVKALKVPYSGSVDLSKHEVDYNVTFDEVSADSQFVDNEVKVVSHADGWYGKVTVKFTDGTDWFDTSDSSYPVLDSKDGSVQFKVLEKLISGDQVLLVDANSVLGEKPKFSLKTVDSVSESRVLQTGILFTVDGSHLVLTKTAADKEAYVALEHNYDIDGPNIGDSDCTPTCVNRKCTCLGSIETECTVTTVVICTSYSDCSLNYCAYKVIS